MNVFIAGIACLFSFCAGLIIGAAMWWEISGWLARRKGESREDYVIRMAAEQPTSEVVFEGKKRIQ